MSCALGRGKRGDLLEGSVLKDKKRWMNGEEEKKWGHEQAKEKAIRVVGGHF